MGANRNPFEDQQHEFNTQPTSQILLIGIGNEFRSDDGLGVCVARQLRGRLPDAVRVIEQSGEGASLMAAWKEHAHVLIVDAVSSGEPAGCVHRLDAHSVRIPKRFLNSSSHQFGVAEAIELARQLGELPGTLMVYGIEAQSFEPGVGLSASVVKSVPDLLHTIEHDIEVLRSSSVQHHT